MPRYFLQFLVLVTFLCGRQFDAQAAQWQTLTGTSRHKVAYDEQSISLTPHSGLSIVLRFIPLGEAERKAAAAAYHEKRYRSHLEFYEIDCIDQTASLDHIDILGTSRTKIKRLPGGTKPDSILPGSVLDRAAQRICPTPDEDNGEITEIIEPEQAFETVVTDDVTLSSDKLLEIENLRNKTLSKDATAEMWKELGNIYFDTDQPELAIKAYERVLLLRPTDTDTLNDMGAMYRQAGDFERALSHFEKACSIDPHNLESLYNSGYVYFYDLNNTQKALDMWQRYLELDTTSETARQVQSFIEQYGK